MRKTGDCPNCQKRCNKVEFSYERTIRNLDCVEKKTYITFSEYKINADVAIETLKNWSLLRNSAFLQEDLRNTSTNSAV